MKDFWDSLFSIDSAKEAIIVLGTLGLAKLISMGYNKAKGAVRNSSWVKGTA